MKLSIIIVNFNVKYFLHQCLTSLYEAFIEFEKVYGKDSSEIIVIDNNSYDGSNELIKNEFPKLQLIENKENLGFSKANNQGISKSKGEYILILNPDTLIAEDTLVKVIEFMDKKTDAGGVGVKMINGSGKFLPESKRSFPYPNVSFFKIFGLSKLFPNSMKFGKYHLTYLDENEINEIDVLSGAFMCIRRKVTEKIGGLDESFFMYGEDIDYSYRIKEAGYKNYYFPETKIIHYKGESTKKESFNYVMMFYNAMIIFSQKHFSKAYKQLNRIFIKLAVIFRAGLSFINRIVKELFLPFIDFVLIYLGFYLITPIWEKFKFDSGGKYPEEYLLYFVPLYIVVWIILIYLSKGYKRPVESKNLFKGIITGTLFLLVIYSLLNEGYRYSRVLLIFGSFWAMMILWIFRLVLGIAGFKSLSFNNRTKKKFLIIGKNNKEIEDILNFPQTKDSNKNIFLYNGDNVDFTNLKTLIHKENVNCIVYDLNFTGVKRITEYLEKLSGKKIEHKIFHAGISSILGTKSILTKNEFYISEINIKKPENLRRKRISDIILSVLFLIFSPVIVLIIDEKRGLFGNIFNVLNGKYSWVGYIPCKQSVIESLPKIKEGILHPEINTYSKFDEIYMLNINYASNFTLIDDLYIIYKSFSKIGHKKL